MYLRNSTTHHWSQNDAIYYIRQHARMATSLLLTSFVSRANHMSTDATLNANEMM
jgi:hypothetical protein